MESRTLHRWDVSPSEAVEIQRTLRGQVREEPLATQPRLVAGADVSFERFSDVVYAGFVVLDLDSGAEVARSIVTTQARFPYVPGIFSFREAPVLLEAWAKLRVAPDVVVFDGHGYAHPRRVGLACHMGLLIDRPTFGCAKTILVGRYRDLGEERGSVAPLVDRGEVVGLAVRTRARTSPIFVSVGHKITLGDALGVTLSLADKYRIPEATRAAHIAVNEARVAARP